MVTDPIADFITQIKNASAIGQATVTVPYSDFKMRVAELLKKEGYLGDVEKKGKKVRKSLEVAIAYEEDGTPKVKDVKRLSKPSRRMYRGAQEMKPVRGGYGVVVVSTPDGVMTGHEARKKNVGGEILFEIW